MGLINWLFGNIKITSTDKKQRVKHYKRKTYYHVFKTAKDSLPLCTFQSKRNAYKFANRVSRQNRRSALIVYSYDNTYISDEQRRQNELDDMGQRI